MVCSAFAPIPGGWFTMGTDRGQPDERPPHRVFVDPFELAVCPVTRAEYERFIDATGHELPRDWTHPPFMKPDLPVVGVSWLDAVAYCAWRSAQDGRDVRLPTEAEWEFAARIAPDQSVLEFPWSGGFPPRGRAGNFADQNARELVATVISDFDDGFAAAAPVGSFPANLRGFHDLGGNVSEWVHDRFGDLGSVAVTDPLGPATNPAHTVRGSSWAHGTPDQLRLGYRVGASGPRPDLGFRLARYAQ